MNGVTYLAEEYGADTWPSSPSPASTARTARPAPRWPPRRSGSRSSTTARARSCPGADQTPVITELVNAEPDIVWATVNPTTLAEIMGGAVAQGFTPSGRATRRPTTSSCSAPTWPRSSTSCTTYSTYTQLWNSADVPGHDGGGRGRCARSGPTRRSSDVYIVGLDRGLHHPADPRAGGRQRRHDPRRRRRPRPRRSPSTSRASRPTRPGPVSPTTTSCVSRTCTTSSSPSSPPAAPCPTRMAAPASACSRARSSPTGRGVRLPGSLLRRLEG